MKLPVFSKALLCLMSVAGKKKEVCDLRSVLPRLKWASEVWLGFCLCNYFEVLQFSVFLV